MPKTVHGWVEISCLDPDHRNEEYAWSGVINIGSLIDGVDDVSHALFGIPVPLWPGSGECVVPLAAGRGIPANPSEYVSQELAVIRQWEARSGLSEVFGYTWINYEEVQGIDWGQFGVENFQQSDWALLFRLIEQITKDPRYMQAGIRIVFWAAI